ncbi:MAG: hypothetical protein CBD39_00640 [Flavobacteriaceae bacterium TMED179]|nr:MAG: hypothetical protein CBD39_00640 [Flavobacteriaceae bacterium TMED179]|tara:strand:- start:935 stop:1681 length:747 start_codon:yes stop_codon:yes gene_type:complete
MKNTLLLLFAIILSSTYGQRDPDAEYWNTFHYKAKAGMENKFIQSAAKKTRKFNSSPDNLIVTYKVTTGQNAGTYERIMPFQTSEGYDRDASDELKYWADNVMPYAESIGGQQIWKRESWADVNVDESTPPFKYLIKNIYVVKQTHIEYFARWAERIGKVMENRRPNSSRIMLSLVSGGRGNTFVSYVAFNRFNDTNPDFDSSWEDDYNEMFGWETFKADRRAFRESLEMIIGHQRESLELVEALLPN